MYVSNRLRDYAPQPLRPCRSPLLHTTSDQSTPTCNKTKEPRPTAATLFHFLMRRMLPAGIAELTRLQTLAVLLLVLGRRVVAILAVAAL